MAKREVNKNADDPLFRPVDADDFRVNGDNASDFSNLVDNGLVRVTMPLPLNVRLIDPATGQPTGRDLSRSLACGYAGDQCRDHRTGRRRSDLAARRSTCAHHGPDPNGPNRQGGYQHDARFATLQEQARGALIAHAQVSMEPPSNMLDDLAAFQQTLFSSPAWRAGRSDPLGSTPFPDPDPELNELEQQGKAVFNRACAHLSRRIAASEQIDARDDVRAPDRALSQHLRPLVRAPRRMASCLVRRGSRATRARTASRSRMARPSHSPRRIRDACFSLASSPTSE